MKKRGKLVDPYVCSELNYVLIGSDQIDGLVHVCSISMTNALEILQSYIKPSK